MQQETYSSKRLHLINQSTLTDKRLNCDQLKQFILDNDINSMRKKYNVVSIIGSQSTGKSTLLNKVFGTDFDVQVRGKGLGQTTIGIWLSRDLSSNVLVLDVEGSDSVERKATDTVVENQTALFALAMSHAFIINVFLNVFYWGECYIFIQSLGQHTACQLSIIKVIMQMNLKLFKQDTVKNIIFVIRDWEEEASYEDALNRVNKYLIDIWNDIPKSDDMQNAQFSSLFKVQVVTLCYYRMKEFNDQTANLHKRLSDSQDSEYLFKEFDSERNLPIDAMPQYLANIWDTIAHNKDLNLPNEKILVSNLRCQQIKQEALDQSLPLIESLSKLSNQTLYIDFSAQGQRILQQTIDKYNTETRDYSKEVVDEKRFELESEIINRLYVLFQKQVEFVKRIFTEDLVRELDFMRDNQSIEDTPAAINEFRKILPEQFSQKLNELTIRPNIWREQDCVDSFEQHLKSQIDNFVDNQMTVHYQRLDKKLKNLCETKFNELLGSIDTQFWVNLQSWFENILSSQYIKFENLLTSFGTSDSNKEKQLRKLEIEAYENLTTVINQQNIRFKEVLFQKFKQIFHADTNGQPRDWQRLTEEEIMTLFTESKAIVHKLLDLLKYHQIKTKSVVKISVQRSFNSMVIIQRADSVVMNNKKDNIDIECIVLSEIQTQSIKTQLNEEIETVYNDAISKHRSNLFQQIPKWFWFILLFFMYDDILRWIGQPLFLYPILMVICFVGFCIAIGYQTLPMLLFQQLVKTVTSSAGPLLFNGINKLK